MGMRVIQIPMSIIGGAYSQVFFQKATEEYKAGHLSPYFKKTSKFLGLVSLAISLIFFVGGQWIFTFVLGEKWLIAGKFTQILSPWFAVWFVSSITSTVLLVTQRQDLGLLANIVILVSRVLSVYIGVYFKNAEVFIIALSALGLLSYGLMLFLSAYSARRIRRDGSASDPRETE
jgi:O-antigen/teichoic acid export membrane protein